MTKPKGRFGYLFLDPQLDSRKKRRADVSQRSVFSPAREREAESFLSRVVMLLLLAAGFSALYFALR